MRNRQMRVLKINSLLIISLTTALVLPAGDKIPENKPDRPGNVLQLMFYNVENLFDTLDSNLDDDEFLPSSPRKWDSYKYYRKLDNIFKVIVLCSNDMEAPDLIGLCEVESPVVLRDLCDKTYLSREAYGYKISAGRDERGINTALLYRKEKLSLLMAESWCPLNEDGTFINTRAILYASFKYDNDTIDVMICHWPSRRGGTIPSDNRRKAVASYMRSKIDSIGRNRKIIIMGDFNDEPSSESIHDMLGAETKINNVKGNYLINTARNDSPWAGSYKYQGTWCHFDQIILSAPLYESDSGLYYLRNSFRIVNNEVLLTDDTSYRGLRPFSTWWGYEYAGGFSDHLPVIAGLCAR
ncbi:MAG TPA: endonuclease [Bacteroidetes bacterium]|nr:endonuclease [Bacteroidota bacterium]